MWFIKQITWTAGALACDAFAFVAQALLPVRSGFPNYKCLKE